MRKLYLIFIFLLSTVISYGQMNQAYETLPDIPACKAGVVSQAEKLKVAEYINFIRSLHGLEPLEYDFAGDAKAQAAALVMVANNTITHQPPTNYQCFTQDAFDGAENSSLHISWNQGQFVPSEVSIVSWMIDDRVEQLGHRFAIIHPHLTKFSFGRSEGVPKVNHQYPYTTSMSFKYMDNLPSQNEKPVTVDFVAYPQGNYPKVLVKKDWYLSFTAVTDKTRWFMSKADYSNVKIEMKNSAGVSVAISDTTSKWASSAGVMNILQWKAPSIVDNEEYTVTIKNVKIGSQTKDYTYKFKLVDKVTPIPGQVVLTSPANNSTEVSLKPKLSWNPASGEINFYEVQYAEDNSFAMSYKDSTNSTFKDIITNLKASTKYFWRVRATNSAGSGPWSEIWSFKTQANTIKNISIIDPADNSVDIDLEALLRWDFLTTDRDNYELIISKNQQLTNPVATYSNITENEFKVPKGKLEQNTKYYWQVQAIKDAAYSGRSPVSSFTTKNLVSVEEEPVSEPVVSENPNSGVFEIIFSISSQAEFEGKIYSSQGIEVANLHKRTLVAGEHKIPVKLIAASGAYFIKLHIGKKEYELSIRIAR